jgi:hypothetical protein
MRGGLLAARFVSSAASRIAREIILPIAAAARIRAAAGQVPPSG